MGIGICTPLVRAVSHRNNFIWRFSITMGEILSKRSFDGCALLQFDQKTSEGAVKGFTKKLLEQFTSEYQVTEFIESRRTQKPSKTRIRKFPWSQSEGYVKGVISLVIIGKLNKNTTNIVVQQMFVKSSYFTLSNSMDIVSNNRYFRPASYLTKQQSLMRISPISCRE